MNIINPLKKTRYIIMKIDDEHKAMFIGRKYKDQKQYKRIANQLICRLTTTQKNGLNIDDQPLFAFEEVVNEYHYKGWTEKRKTKCICGNNITEVHKIVNKKTDQIYNIGSSCCAHWAKTSHLNCTKPKINKILSWGFKAFSINRDMEKEEQKYNPIFIYGVRKGEYMKDVVKVDMDHCVGLHWNTSQQLEREVCFKTHQDLAKVIKYWKRQLRTME